MEVLIFILTNSELLLKFFNKIKIKINTNIFYTIFGIILLLISFGFLYLFFGNKRLKAGEAGGKTWWHNLRLFHGMMYLCASIYILKNILNLLMMNRLICYNYKFHFQIFEKRPQKQPHYYQQQQFLCHPK